MRISSPLYIFHHDIRGAVFLKIVNNFSNIIQIHQIAQDMGFIQDFISWQTTEIGRDINPTELIRRVRDAGAKRVELTSPAFTAVQETEVARLGSQKVTYGGLEDD